MEKVNREFYNRNSLLVAKELLGKYLVHVVGGEELICKLVEVEAYMGPEDKAAHSYGGRRTERVEVMYGPAGYAYVYIIYGMYYCLNVVVEREGLPQAVLIRGAEPIKGLEEMSKLRFKKEYKELKKREVINLTSGPGKLCSALNIDKTCNGADLCGENLYILEGEKEPFEIGASARVNIDYAEEYREKPWRFFIKDNPFVSKGLNKKIK